MNDKIKASIFEPDEDEPVLDGAQIEPKPGKPARTAPAEIWCAELDGSNDRQVTVLESSDMDIRVLNALDANLFFKIRTKGTSALYALYEGQDMLTQMCELS